MTDKRDPRTASGRWKTMDSHRSPVRMVQRKAAGIVAVYEHVPTEDDPEPRALVFEAAEFTIRLTEFPADWHRLTDDELVALSRA